MKKLLFGVDRKGGQSYNPIIEGNRKHGRPTGAERKVTMNYDYNTLEATLEDRRERDELEYQESLDNYQEALLMAGCTWTYNIPAGAA